MNKLLKTQVNNYSLLANFIFCFSVIFTIFNRFANTYFWNRSLKVQVLLLIVLSSVATILIYLLFNYLLPKSMIRPVSKKFIITATALGLLWVMLPFASSLYKGEFRTPENSRLFQHHLQIIATGQNNTQSNGSEVKIQNIELRDQEGGVVLFELVDKNNIWSIQNQELVSPPHSAASMNFDFISIKENSHLDIILSTSPDSGNVVISLDGMERTLDLYEGQEGETLVTLPIPSNGRLLFLVAFFRIFEALAIIAIFRVKNNKVIFLSLLAIYSIFLIFTVWNAPIIKFGDAYEYLFTTQAFQNHSSPNPIDSDIPSVNSLLLNSRLHLTKSNIPNHAETNSGLRFSYHFWFYSLIVVPAKVLLEKMGFIGLLSFQLTNTVLLLTSLWCFALLGNFEDRRKWLLTAFLAVNPVLWYLIWWTPEVFTYSCVVLSLTFFSNKNYHKAVFFAALASMQNQPLIFIVGYYVFLDLYQYWPKISLKILIQSGIPTIPMFIPPLFYYVFFGTPSLIIRGGTGPEHISLAKFLDFFLDLNMGIFPYMPILILLFVIVFANDVIKKKGLNIIFGCSIILMVLSTAQMGNWNSDCNGIMRYGVWVVPVLAFFTVGNLNEKSFWQTAWTWGIVYQLFVIMIFGGINANISYVQMTPIGQVVLDHFPRLYSPEKETFMERTNHREMVGVNFNFSFYRSKDAKITKILTDYENFKKFRTLENIAVKIFNANALDNEEFYLKNNEGLQYLNFANGEIEVLDEIVLREAMAN